MSEKIEKKNLKEIETNKEYSLNLNGKELGLILQLLSNQPYNQVVVLIEKITSNL